MTVPDPVERCGYTITPALGIGGTFNPLTSPMRITKDGQWAMFPALLWEDVAKADDDTVQRVLASLFYQAESPTIFGLPNVHDGLMVRKTVAYVSMSDEMYEENKALADAQEAYFAMTPEQRAERHRAADAERAPRLAAQLAAAESLVADLGRAAQIDAREGGTALIDAVLAVHRPQVVEGDHHVTCSTCWDGGDYAERAEWPCPTIEAIKEAAS
jgi:hypothetical protein